MSIDVFAPYTLAADLLELERLFADLFERLGAHAASSPRLKGVLRN